MWLKIPGSSAEYAVELLAVQTTAAGTEQCVQNVPASMVDPKTGTFRIRSTGRVRTPRERDRQAASSAASSRRCAASRSSTSSGSPTSRRSTRTRTRRTFSTRLGGRQLRRATATSATTNCQDPASLDGRQPRRALQDQRQHLGLRHADLRARRQRRDRAQRHPPGLGAGLLQARAPNFKGTVDCPAGQLPMPQSNAELAAAADPGYVVRRRDQARLQRHVDERHQRRPTTSKALPAERRHLREQHELQRGLLAQAAYSSTAPNYMTNPGCGNV